MSPILPLAEPAELKRMSGLERAAALMLALGKDHGAPLWSEFSEEEVKELSATMAQLGSVPSAVVEYLFVEFATNVSTMAACHGSYETTERLLSAVMSPEQVRQIMDEIKGPNGRTMWDKLGNVSETVLASYLKNEYPQTAAVILSKLKPEHSARVLTEFPPDIAVEVVNRMLKMEPVSNDVLVSIEGALRAEFISGLSRTQKVDPHESLAEVFNALDRQSEESLLGGLEVCNPDSAERIRSLMFTFEDLSKMSPTNIQVLLSKAEKKGLTLAMKGSSEATKEIFFSNMSERARKALRDDLLDMGPVRLRDVEEAQQGLVRLAKKLAEAGEIDLVDSKLGNEELIY